MVTTSGLTGQRPRPARNARYLFAAAASLLLWYGVNFWPGWHTIPVLTPSTDSLLSLVNLWLLASAVANAMLIVFDATWFKSAWQIFVTTTGIALAARLYLDFPFDFSMAYYYDFRGVARLALVAAVVGGLFRLIVVGIRFVQASMRAVDDFLWTRQVRSTMRANTYMAAIARPLPVGAASAAPAPAQASWGDRSGSIARAVADTDNPASSTLARFAELGGVLETAVTPAPHPAPDAGTTRRDEARRSRRAHASGGGPKLQLPRLGRRKAGSHAAH